MKSIKRNQAESTSVSCVTLTSKHNNRICEHNPSYSNHVSKLIPMVWDVWGRDQPASDLLSTFDMNRLLLLFLRKSTGVFRLTADGAIKEISVSARDQLKTQLDCTRARAALGLQ